MRQRGCNKSTQMVSKRAAPYLTKRGSFTHKSGNGILERWLEYFDELLNGQLNDELKVPTTQGVDTVLEPPIRKQPVYYVKVVRSPDGESRSYSIGQLSIQRAAVWVLQKYYTEFSIFNPYLERIPVSKSQRKALSTFKYYDVDGVNASQQQSQSRAVLAAHARRRDSSHNERFYEEHEYERRVKKRKARLITAAEEAFTHIKRVHNEPAPAIPLDPQEAAQAVFPSMARALQKYLRVTRQQPRHTVESILRHLAHCLKHDLAPRAFLEPYLVEYPVMQSEKERRPVQSWSLICDELLSRPLSDGCSFQLIQSDVSLVVTVHRLPHFHVAEEVVDPKSNKFVLKLNSETSV
uniref:Vang-like protein n=1 Tax=Phlebotomus papatasi TaxID=29031 RepID=A0A1B0GPM2_PHLPP